MSSIGNDNHNHPQHHHPLIIIVIITVDHIPNSQHQGNSPGDDQNWNRSPMTFPVESFWSSKSGQKRIAPLQLFGSQESRKTWPANQCFGGKIQKFVMQNAHTPDLWLWQSAILHLKSLTSIHWNFAVRNGESVWPWLRNCCADGPTKL